ncbi:MAG: hypothetical protein E7039_08175 [Lentisphaerae bacterium]|nr:hypothetical protein [Lentisphaerota bacterium]
MKSIVCIVCAALTTLMLPAAELSGVLTPEVLQKRSFELPAGVYTTGNFTLPENFTLNFAPGAMIEVKKGAVLRINGAFNSSLQQIFSGEGKVEGKPQITAVYPEWFGAKGDDKTDNTTALQKAANLAEKSQGRLLQINQGRYRFSADITIKCNVVCRGTLVFAMELDPGKTHDRFRVHYPYNYPKRPARVMIMPDEQPYRMNTKNFFGIKRNTFKLPKYKALAVQNSKEFIDLKEGGTLTFLSTDFFTTRANNRNDEYYNKEDIVMLTSYAGDVFPEFNFDFDDFTQAPAWDAARNYKKGDYVKVGKDIFKATLASGPNSKYSHKTYGTCTPGPRDPAKGLRQKVTYTNGKKDILNFWVKLNYIVEYTPPQQPLTIDGLAIEAYLTDDDPNVRVVHSQLMLCKRSNVTFNNLSLKITDPRLHIYNLLSISGNMNLTFNRCYFSGALMHGMGYNVMSHNTANNVFNNCISVNCRNGLGARHGKNITINGGHYNRIDDHYGKNYVIRDCVFDAWSTWVLGYRTPKCDPNKLIRTRSTAVVFAGENITIENCKVYNPRYILCNRADVGDFGGKIVLRDIAIFSDNPVTVVNHTVHDDFDYAHDVIKPQTVLIDNVTRTGKGELRAEITGTGKNCYILRDSDVKGLNK